MLKEFKKLRQVEEISRRLFTDNYFDLYLWYKKDSRDFIGFQLVFCFDRKQMALTAEVGKVPNVHIVDSGDDEFYDPTDILDGAGYFPKRELYREFKERSKDVDKSIRKSVLKVIHSYKIDSIYNRKKLEPIY